MDPSCPGLAAPSPRAGVLVIGYGNELRGDDGAGVEVARRLDRDPRLGEGRVLALRQLTPELAADVAAARLVVFVDATVDVPAGEVSVGEVAAGATAQRSAPFSHRLTPGDLLALAGEAYGTTPESVVVAIGVASLEPVGSLSPGVEAALPRVLDLVAELAMGTGR